MALKDWKKIGSYGYENQKDGTQISFQKQFIKGDDGHYLAPTYYLEILTHSSNTAQKVSSLTQGIILAKKYMRSH